MLAVVVVAVMAVVVVEVVAQVMMMGIVCFSRALRVSEP